MYNLLPQENIKELRKEYIFHIVFVCLVFLLFTGIVICVFLLPSYIVSNNREKAAATKEEALKNSTAAKIDQSTSLALKDAAGKIQLISGISGSSVLSVIKKISSYNSASIKINSMSVGPITVDKTQKSQPIQFNGIAKTRESLIAFSKTLQAEKDLSGVVLPVSSFDKDQNIDFSLSLVLLVN